jgi:hypothetical protein
MGVVSMGMAEAQKKTTIPDAVSAALKAMFPKANIKETEPAKESLAVYESEVIDNNQELQVTVAADGIVASVESEEKAETLPDAVKAAIAGGQIKEASKEVSYAELKYVKLAAPVTVYELTVMKDGKEVELKLSADGKVISQKVEEADKEENGKGEKDGKHEEKGKGEKGEKDDDKD